MAEIPENSENRGRPEAIKTSGRPLPLRPPAQLKSKEEKAAWAQILRLFSEGHAWAEFVDMAAVILCAQRLAYVEWLQGIKRKVIKDGEELVPGGNGQVKFHPIFAELRAAEHGLNQSLGSLYLTPRARNNARSGGHDVDLYADNRRPDGGVGADILL